MLKTTDDLRISAIKELTTPIEVMRQHPRTDAATRTVISARHAFHNILTGADDRLAVVVGPCSIHDPAAALDYAKRLSALRDTLGDRLEIIMRVYFEKPRTTVGWKGLINDPNLDGSFDIDNGLHTARALLLDIANLGLPAACEFLDMTTPQYIADLVSWAAIGARTTESQGHRELASGLSCPVGFKNSTNGSYGIAVDAINAASHPHHFMSLTKEGKSAIFSTSGNEDCHIILRGGDQGPNYDAASVAQATEKLIAAGINTGIMIDFSHANSSKQHHKQIEVGHDVAGQIASGNHNIKGLMIESHLNEGRQNAEHINDLAYGVSITDACINWKDTAPLLEVLANAAATRRGES